MFFVQTTWGQSVFGEGVPLGNVTNLLKTTKCGGWDELSLGGLEMLTVGWSQVIMWFPRCTAMDWIPLASKFAMTPYCSRTTEHRLLLRGKLLVAWHWLHLECKYLENIYIYIYIYIYIQLILRASKNEKPYKNIYKTNKTDPESHRNYKNHTKTLIKLIKLILEQLWCPASLAGPIVVSGSVFFYFC